MATIIGTPGNDTLAGTAVNDTISGLDGNDKLSDTTGNDKLDGGANNDYLSGGADNDTLIGGEGNDTLIGGAGINVLLGGLGNDLYVVESPSNTLTELVGQGNDLVLSNLTDFTLGANFEGLALLAAGVNGTGNSLDNSISGNNLANKLDGGFGNDQLTGGEGADTLIGGFGDDTLDGGWHADKMNGGAGNDVYVVNDAGDAVVELAGGGTDLVKTTVNGLILGANVENLTLTGYTNISGTGNALANILTGNAGENTLVGGQGDDTVNGGGDRDRLIGGLGDDTYFVDDPGDIVVESLGEGKDTVHSTVTFTISEMQSIETLILSSAAAVTGTGNSFANAISMTGSGRAILFGFGGNDALIGGSGNDNLYGDSGDDQLSGGEGNDTLNGGTAKDAMSGGNGNDTYVVADVGDTVTELAAQGNDTVYARIASYTLTDNVENLALDTGAVNGTGNALYNIISGNSAANRLDGGSGDDALYGAEGNDILLGGLDQDYMVGGTGNDTLMGGDGFDFLEGGFGADVLRGDAAMDGFGYRIDLPGDLAFLGGDTIHGFQTGVDKIELVDLIWDFGIEPSEAVSGGYVLLTKVGDDTLVQFDKDGFGGAGPLTLATVVDATVAATDLLLDSSF